MMASSALQGQHQLETWAGTLSEWIAGQEPVGVKRKHRLTVYRELIRNNLESFVEPVFPIARTLISSAMWEEWLSDFAQSSYRESPLFRNIAENFLEMLSQYPKTRLSPALLQLMRWEWIEMAVDIAPGAVTTSASGQQLNPTLRIEAFDYPVHEMAAKGKLLPAQPTVLAAWRTKEHQVRAFCPDEVTLQMLLHLDAAENASDSECEQIWQAITAAPSLQLIVQQLQKKDILV